jgi:hypothetical protein
VPVGVLAASVPVGGAVVDGVAAVDDDPSVVERAAPPDGDGVGVRSHGLAAAVTPLP